MDRAFVTRISSDVALPESSVAETIALFERNATVPFVAYYRKEATGGLDEASVRAIHDRMLYYQEVLERRATLLKLLEDQNKLSEELRQKVENCFTKVEVEDLFHQFKPKKKSRAAEATEQGLEPLAEFFWNQEPDAWSVEEHADVFIDPEKKVASRDQAIQGALDIIAEWIAANSDFRKALREALWNDGAVVSTVVPAKAGQKTKYSMYYDRREPVSSIPSHRVLAIRRGTKEGVLTSAIEGDQAKAIEILTNSIIRDKESVFAPLLDRAIRDTYSRLLKPLIETEVRAQLKERADREAIRVFQENLANLLLSPPAGAMAVLGLDPGKGEECKLAAVAETGKFLEEATISPAPPKNDVEGTRAALRDLIARHGIRALAIPGGPAAREVEGMVRQILTEEKLDDILIASVNDAGIAIYASSRVAREEFPDLSVSTRSAISLARRLQDPLSELVKLDPKLIGVGQYQHDVDQKELHRGLLQTVQSCVNRVGVELNSAHYSLLRYVSGISEKLARRIVATRASKGPFPSRAATLSLPGMDETVFQQAAGFIRLRDGEHPLDRTAVHPESYAIVERMAASLGIPLAELVGNRERAAALNLEDFVTENVGLPTLMDIREELLRPGRDPRRTFTAPKFRADVREIGDLKEGMTLEGTVTNVTNFGAFVDIGVRQDGLVHLSQMSNRFIHDPREAVKVGDVVQVKVISVEVETKRIGLSMKALLPPVVRRRRKPRRRLRPEAQAAATVAQADASQPSGDGATAEASGIPIAPLTTLQHPRREGSRPPRHRKRAPRPQGRAQETQQEVADNPEQTLQEKIAILQSKFRGLH